MADGALKWGSGYVARALQYAAHTDGSAKVVATLTFPAAILAVDGYYHVTARVWGGTATGANVSGVLMQGFVKIDGGVVGAVSAGDVLGTPVYATAFAISAGNTGVDVTVTAANGYHSAAYVEALGFELGITPA